MGVPKFFRYISERYPCLSELVKEFQIPDFDNLYLDMNGIIHACSHPNDFDPYFSITEDKIFASIFHYIEVLFNMIKPRKIFFMAVDGVAPRAKMNQQRARRFRSAKEAEIREKKAIEENNVPLQKERFDSNSITPGTVFMERLHSQLQYFITSKISTDPFWQNCKIILSGHQTPGEGEHKIMDYIRYLKTLPDYDDNTRHCLYGLDADLIMLGLCTHEPHFCLLREKIQFSKQQNKKILSPDETDFYLLHLSILREYLELEFQELRETLPFQYNLENIIDDWVLMGFLVGNDFIPNLPDLHINKNAFPILYKAYKEVLPTVDGYLNENGHLNLPRFQKFMEKLAEHDLETFEDTYANLAFLEEKTGKSFFDKKPNGEVVKSSELEELIKATEEFLEEEVDENDENYENDENDTFQWEFCQHKKNYYTNKLDYSKVTEEVLKSQAEGYVRAIQWNLHYYYQGCQSWSWYYPHHYAPYISDIRDFKDLKIEFDLGKPFLPFEQLLAVLPAASKNLLPEAYHSLMTSPNSPIKDFYPENFETDLNGKQHDWEAVVLIPFIDEKRLLEAMEPFNEKLTPEERMRNQHGPMHVFTYTDEDLGVYKALEYFPNLPTNHALMKNVFRNEIEVEESKLKYGLRPGVLLDVLYPGFPTLKHIPHTASLKSAKVKVFEQPSRGENMILELKKQEFPPLDVLASLLVGKVIYVNWPHLVESRAISVSNSEGRFYLTKDKGVDYERFNKQMQTQWLGERGTIIRHYAEKLGVEIGPVDIIVHVLTLDGRKCLFGPSGKVVSENIWSSAPTACAFQVIVYDVQVQNPNARQYVDFKDAFPVDSVVFMLGHPHFGSLGRILDSTDCYENLRLNVELETVSDPVIPQELLKSERKVPYMPCGVAAARLGVRPHILSRITGSVLVSMTREEDVPGNRGSKINIGLNLKFFMKNEEIPGYTKRDKDDWLYSAKAVEVVAAYVEKFSRVVEYLSNNQSSKVYFVEDIFPGPEGITEMKEMVAWIKEQEFNKVERLKSGTKFLDPGTVSKIEELIDRTPTQSFKRHLQVKPQFLYKSNLVFGNVPPVSSVKNNLLDRVVSIRSPYTVPTGLRGFIIGIHPAPLAADYLYDILFDKPFVGGMTLNSSPERAFRMSRASFLNVTDANRLPSSKLHACAPPNSLRSKSSSEEPKTSAFAQWSQIPSRPSPRENEEFRKIWSNLQTAKPQEDALKKILKIEKKEKDEEEKKDSVKSFFEKVSEATKESFRPAENNFLSVQKQTPLPTNRYYLQLFSYHQRRNLGQPRFKYLYLGGMVTAQVFCNDGKIYSGLPSHDKESACESAALQALGALGEIPLNNDAFVRKEREREKRVMDGQARLTSALVKPKGANQPNKSSNHRPNDRMPPLLPHPPLRWVGLNRNSHAQGFHTHPSKDGSHVRMKKDAPEKTLNTNNKKLNASALEFVPLQAMTGKRNFGKVLTIQSPKQVQETHKKTEVVPTFISNTAATAASSSTTKSKRKPKIAAKLNLDPNLY